MVEAKLGAKKYKTIVTAGEHQFIIDEPTDIGGQNLGPSPTEILLGALASCTAITMRMYADRKEWDLGEIRVKVERKEVLTEKGVSTRLHKTFLFEKTPTDKQLSRLNRIAELCPVSKLLSQEVQMKII
jgi:putative redox protein